MEAPRLIPKKIEIAFHAGFMIWLLHNQLQIMSQVSSRFKHQLPLSRGTDLTDTQWRDFRGGLPTLSGVLILFTLLSTALRSLKNPKLHSLYYSVFGMVFILYVHGAYAIFTFGFLAVFYAIIKCCSGLKYGKMVVWAVAVALMFFIDYNGGWYRHPPMYKYFFRSNTGVYRWHVGWNIITLRLISFGCDCCEASREKTDSENQSKSSRWLQKHQSECSSCQDDSPCYASRQNRPLEISEYSFVNYVAFILYLPTYIAGPTTTFNAFVSHLHKSQREYNLRYIAFYLWRLIMLIGLLEYGLQNFYVWAIAKSAHVRDQLSPLELALLGFYLLNALWIKFAIIWRFARFFALLDGVEVPENMTRCMNNNFTISGFWRNWHRSFNKWIVRYMYIPLGGRDTQLLNVFPIFLFVSVWHDMELHLLKWGLLMAVFITPEVLISRYFSSQKAAWIRSKWYFRYLKAISGTFNITILMVANLVGFGVGNDTSDIIESITSLWWLILLGFIEFFSATCLMIEVREWEAIQESAIKKL